jgi:DNA processing protein
MSLNTQSVPDMHALPAPSLGPQTVTLPGIGRLHVAGDVRLLDRPGIAVVGSRRASYTGRALAADVACELVRLGLVVLSGLAAGIDATAHESAMHAGGRTIAVLGTSLDQAYPRHHATLQKRIARDHLVVSPFESGTPTARWHFPARNRVMARLANAMVLVEASETSGTRHQVQECIALGRPVLVHRTLLDHRRIDWLTRMHRSGHVDTWESSAELGAQAQRVCGA